jgi:hypothetical protein
MAKLICSFILAGVLTAGSYFTPFREDDKRKLGEFTAVDIQGGFDVVLAESDEYYVELSGDKIYTAEVLTQVRGQCLYISFQDGYFQNMKQLKKDPVKVKIACPSLKGLYVSGANKLHNEGTLRSQELDIYLSGAGTIKLKIAADTLRTELQGSVQVEIEGQVQQHKAELNGTGKYKARQLKAEFASVTLNGIGSMYVHASAKLVAELNGIGSIIYSGNPPLVNAQTVAIGKIRPK